METLGKASLGMIFYKQLCTDFWRGVRQEGDIKKILETNIIEFLKSTFGKRCSIRSCFNLFLFFVKARKHTNLKRSGTVLSPLCWRIETRGGAY